MLISRLHDGARRKFAIKLNFAGVHAHGFVFRYKCIRVRKIIWSLSVKGIITNITTLYPDTWGEYVYTYSSLYIYIYIYIYYTVITTVKREVRG